jgi:hypothetical protein
VLVALGLDQHIEDLALGVDGAPKINQKLAHQFQSGADARSIIGPNWFTQRRTVS